MTNLIITISSVTSSLVVIGSALIAVIHWFQRQSEQDKDIKRLKEEMKLICNGVLACLHGLHEMGCDGPVDTAIIEIERYIKDQAHE